MTPEQLVTLLVAIAALVTLGLGVHTLPRGTRPPALARVARHYTDRHLRDIFQVDTERLTSLHSSTLDRQPDQSIDIEESSSRSSGLGLDLSPATAGVDSAAATTIVRTVAPSEERLAKLAEEFETFLISTGQLTDIEVTSPAAIKDQLIDEYRGMAQAVGLAFSADVEQALRRGWDGENAHRSEIELRRLRQLQGYVKITSDFEVVQPPLNGDILVMHAKHRLDPHSPEVTLQVCAAGKMTADAARTLRTGSRRYATVVGTVVNRLRDDEIEISAIYSYTPC